MILLTYSVPHRKTEDVLFRLMAAGMPPEKVIAIPWVDRKPRRMLYAHRPAEMCWPCDPMGDTEDICHKLHIEYSVSPIECLAEVIGGELVVIGGAGILPEGVVTSSICVNVHPGLLPASRGLDILKWDILELNRVGATAHICDNDTDLGWRMIERRVPVFRNDTFHSFAMRQYETELGMIPEALRMLYGKTRSDFEKIDRLDTEARKRMGRRVESGIPAAFERFKDVYAK